MTGLIIALTICLLAVFVTLARLLHVESRDGSESARGALRALHEGLNPPAPISQRPGPNPAPPMKRDGVENMDDLNSLLHELREGADQ